MQLYAWLIVSGRPLDNDRKVPVTNFEIERKFSGFRLTGPFYFYGRGLAGLCLTNYSISSRENSQESRSAQKSKRNFLVNKLMSESLIF